MHRPSFAMFFSGGYVYIPRKPKPQAPKPLPIRATVASILALFALLAVLLSGGVTAEAATAVGCQTPFIVFTDPDHPGTTSTRGSITTVRNSGVLGNYSGDGRFAGYTIAGKQVLIVNSATSHALVRGSFTATSPDGHSSFVIRYTGEVDLTTGVATGAFSAGNGTGLAKGLRTAGTIEAQLVGPLTFNGIDIGLC